MIETINHMMTLCSMRQKRWKPRKYNEMTHCHDMPPKSESLPTYGFTFGFISAI